MAAAAPRVLQLLYEAEAVSEPGVLRWWAGRGEDRRPAMMESLQFLPRFRTVRLIPWRNLLWRNRSLG